MRALRWAADRIGDNGIVSFVTNGNFIETPSMDGLRASLAKEFSAVYVIDLKGDSRNSRVVEEDQGGNIFNVRTPIAITLLVKQSPKSGCKIKYHNIGDFLSGDEKLKSIAKTSNVVNIKDWEHIAPSKQHTWLNQRDPRFAKFMSMENVKGETDTAIFNLCSLGVVTSRDAWVYNYDRQTLAKNVKKTIAFYNSELARWQERTDDLPVEKFINRDDQKISWSAKEKISIQDYRIREGQPARTKDETSESWQRK